MCLPVLYNKTKPARSQHQIFFMWCQTWYFILNIIICHFSGDGTVMWTTTHTVLIFFLHIILRILSQYVQNYRPAHEQTNILLDQLQNTCTEGGYYYRNYWCRANETRSKWTRSIFSVPMRRVPIGRVPMRRVPNRRVYYIGRYIHADELFPTMVKMDA